jgi:hypothetical protein
VVYYKECCIVDIWECVLGFMDAQILLTAEELGIFAVLDGDPCRADEVAKATDLPADSAERLLNALATLGAIQKTAEGRFVNGPEASAQLVPGKPDYMGAMFHHVREDLYPMWHYFKEALQERQSQWQRAHGTESAANENLYSDPAALRKFMEGMHTITYRVAQEFAARAPELEEIKTLVDLGGASGAFLIALAQARPWLRGAVFDLPQVEPITRDFFRRYEVADRLDFVAGNFWEDPLPPRQDAYALGFVLHDWSTEQGSAILRKIARAAGPGAFLIVSEYLLDEDKTGPKWVVRSDLNMLVAARGRERNAAEYRQWVEAAGFNFVRVHETTLGKHFLIFKKNV